MTSVAVIGGGITGLTAAHLLHHGGHDVVLLESDSRVGGKIRSERFHGVDLEAGADAFLPRDDLPLKIARRAGLGDSLIEPRVFGAYIWTRGSLRRVPPGFSYGLPRSPAAAWRAGLLSVAGAARASLERVVGRRLRGPDISIADFVRTRFGREVLDELVDPMLAGTRAGRPRQISLAAGAREIDGLARRHRSVLRALGTTGTEIGAGSSSFVSIAGGLGRLCTALSKELADVRLGVRVEGIERTIDGYEIHSGTAALRAAHVIVAAPAHAAASLVRGLSEEAAERLASIPYASGALIALAYPRGSFEAPRDGSGVLVPSREERIVDGITWYSRKWASARPADGSLIVRCFVGRAYERTAGLDDGELTAAVAKDVGSILSTDPAPTESAVFRWERALPVYEVGHLDRVAAIRAALPPGIAIAGAAYDGTGIPDCMRSAAAAATLVSGS